MLNPMDYDAHGDGITDDDVEKWITNIFVASFNNDLLIANNIIKSNLMYRYFFITKKMIILV